MPVDNDTRLWTTCGPNVENTLSAARTRVDARVQPSAALNESAFCATVVSEGHPRGNGDGPLTTKRSLETKGGRS